MVAYGEAGMTIESATERKGAIIAGIAVLTLAALIAFFLTAPRHNDEMRTRAVTSATAGLAAMAPETSDAPK